MGEIAERRRSNWRVLTECKPWPYLRDVYGLKPLKSWETFFRCTKTQLTSAMQASTLSNDVATTCVLRAVNKSKYVCCGRRSQLSPRPQLDLGKGRERKEKEGRKRGKKRRGGEGRTDPLVKILATALVQITANSDQTLHLPVNSRHHISRT